MGERQQRAAASVYGTWRLSLGMLVLYVAVFHVWLHVGYGVAVTSGLGVAVAMAAAIDDARRDGYFRGILDWLAHLVVALDVLIEGCIPHAHTHLGFYWCAVAFAVVIGAYRWRTLRSEAAPPARGAPS
jgi:hypothetical protein